MVFFSSLKSTAAKKSQQEFTIWGGRETNNDKKTRESPNQTQATTHKPHTPCLLKNHIKKTENWFFDHVCASKSSYLMKYVPQK